MKVIIYPKSWNKNTGEFPEPARGIFELESIKNGVAKFKEKLPDTVQTGDIMAILN